MENDLISIVVPVYNVELYLDDCIKSLIRQDYSNIEILLIDDGSTDFSGDICDKWVKQDSRISSFHKENGGLSDARNYGIRKAKGKYITFIDSDDTVATDYVKYLYSLLKKYQTRMSICSYSVVQLTKNKEKVLDFGAGYREEVLSVEHCLERMLNEQGFTVSACAKMYELSLFDHIEFPVGKLCEDNGTTYKLILQCKNIVYGNQSKYFYYKRENSIMTSKFNLKKMDMIELTDQMCEDILQYFASLDFVVKRRRMYARFNVLRQMVLSPISDDGLQAKKQIVSFLKENKNDILKNPCSNLRDKFAMFSLLIHEKVFAFSWKIYAFFRR